MNNASRDKILGIWAGIPLSPGCNAGLVESAGPGHDCLGIRLRNPGSPLPDDWLFLRERDGALEAAQTRSPAFFEKLAWDPLEDDALLALILSDFARGYN